jgi:hypothetical protein
VPIEVDRKQVPVMFVTVDDFPAGIAAAWNRLEAAVGSLGGRRFYGAFDPAARVYRACVEMHEDDDAAALGLEVDTLPGGRYLRERVQGEPPEVYERIGPAFDELSRAAKADMSRPSLEFYRRRDEIDVLLPIAD